MGVSFRFTSAVVFTCHTLWAATILGADKRTTVACKTRKEWGHFVLSEMEYHAQFTKEATTRVPERLNIIRMYQDAFYLLHVIKHVHGICYANNVVNSSFENWYSEFHHTTYEGDQIHVRTGTKHVLGFKKSIDKIWFLTPFMQTRQDIVLRIKYNAYCTYRMQGKKSILICNNWGFYVLCYWGIRQQKSHIHNTGRSIRLVIIPALPLQWHH